MIKDMLILILFLGITLIGMNWIESSKVNNTLKRTAQICEKNCAEGGYKWTGGIMLNPTSKEINCFCGDKR